MYNIWLQLTSRIRKLVRSGFFDVFGATVINSLVSFVYGVFIVRILSTTEYGGFSYAQNIVNFGLLFCGLGVNLGVLQFCAEAVDINLKYSYSRFALRVGTVSSLMTATILVFYSKFDRSNIANVALYIIEFSPLPILFFLKDWIVSNLRWQLRNQEYGKIMNLHSISNAVFAVIGAMLAGVSGAIFSICLSYVLVIMVGFFCLKKDLLPFVMSADKLKRPNMGDFVNYSITMCVVNALIAVLFTVDIFVIGNLMHDAEEVAKYRIASVIPYALNMIPNSIMTFVYPHFAMHKNDQKWLRKNTIVLYCANASVNLLVGMFLYVLAPLLITFLFGSQYDEVVPIFRILVLSYIVSSCLRTPAANLFGILRKTKTALTVSVCTVILSVSMSFALVGRLGIYGAAIGSVCTFGIVGIVSTSLLFWDIYKRKK